MNADNNDWGRGLAAPARVGDITQQVRRVALGLAVVWLGLVASVGWWASQRWVADWVDGLAASAQQEAQATARVMDRLFTEMASVANMVASQGNVVALAFRRRPVLDFHALYERAFTVEDLTGLPARQWVSTSPVMELDNPSQPKIWLMGSSTTWNGMNTPNNNRPNSVSLPRNFQRLRT